MLVPLVVNLRAILKFLAHTVPEIWRGSQNSKSRSRDPFPIPFDLIFHFCLECPRWSICMPNLKFLAQTVPEIWRRSQNSKSRSRDPLTIYQLGVDGDPIFEILDPDMPIHYTTFMGLRWRLRVVYSRASPLLSVLAENFLSPVFGQNFDILGPKKGVNVNFNNFIPQRFEPLCIWGGGGHTASGYEGRGCWQHSCADSSLVECSVGSSRVALILHFEDNG